MYYGVCGFVEVQKASSQPNLYRIPPNVTLPDHYHCYLSEESPCALRLTGAPYTELVSLLQNVRCNIQACVRAFSAVCFNSYRRTSFLLT